MRRAFPLLACVVAEIVAVVALHRLGRVPGMSIPLHDLGSWLHESKPEDAIGAVLRVIALACAWWQLTATLGYVAARLARAPRAIRALGRARLLPLVRRSVDRALVMSVVAGTALTSTGSTGTAAPAPGPPTSDPAVVEVRSGRAAPPPAGAPTRPGPPPPMRPVETFTSPTPVDPGAHTVVVGDNLWTIAAAHLAASTGRSAEQLTEAEIASYWVRVCDTNRGRIRSGDVDLIVPGESIVLPPI